MIIIVEALFELIVVMKLNNIKNLCQFITKIAFLQMPELLIELLQSADCWHHNLLKYFNFSLRNSCQVLKTTTQNWTQTTSDTKIRKKHLFILNWILVIKHTLCISRRGDKHVNYGGIDLWSSYANFGQWYFLFSSIKVTESSILCPKFKFFWNPVSHF